MSQFRLVLPCYNESNSLKQLAARAIGCAQKRGLSAADFTLVLVENGSADNSLSVMQALQKEPGGEFIRVVPITENRGYGFGVWSGLRAAAELEGIIGWTHADEQCDPEDAFRAWEILQNTKESTLIKGRRHGRLWKEQIITRGFEIAALFILGKRITEINAQPKVFHSELVARLNNPPLDFSFDLYVLLEAMRANLKIKEIDVLFPPRKHGQSNWSATFRSKYRNISKAIKFMYSYRSSLR